MLLEQPVLRRLLAFWSTKRQWALQASTQVVDTEARQPFAHVVLFGGTDRDNLRATVIFRYDRAVLDVPFSTPDAMVAGVVVQSVRAVERQQACFACGALEANPEVAECHAS